MELINSPECVLDGVLVVRCMEVEKVNTVSLQPLQGGFQLWAHTLWLQSFAIPGVGLGGYAYCHTNTINER